MFGLRIARGWWRMAGQCALAAALCLGIPAALALWLALLEVAWLAPALNWLRSSGVHQVSMLVASSWLWSFLLGRISGYAAWWRIGLATSVGILAGWFSPLSNMDGWFADELPVPTLYALTLCGMVAGVTLCVGAAYGIVLRNFRAVLFLALGTSAVAVLAALLGIGLWSALGVYVGSGVPFAMSKVTVVSLLLAGSAGGAVLGAGFTHFAQAGSGQRH